MSAVEHRPAAHEADGVAMIEAFCRTPSVSADPAFADSIAKAAAVADGRLRQAGFALVALTDPGRGEAGGLFNRPGHDDYAG